MSKNLNLKAVTPDYDYLKEWNCNLRDFYYLCDGDNILNNNTLYRVGGMGVGNLNEVKYFLLLKYVEEFYDDKITTDIKRKKHLQSHWVIIDSNGVEQHVSNSFDYINLIEDSDLFSIKNEYYSLKTKKFICKSFKVMTSKKFVFLEDNYNLDETKRGVYVVDKSTGKYDFFKK